MKRSIRLLIPLLCLLERPQCWGEALPYARGQILVGVRPAGGTASRKSSELDLLPPSLRPICAQAGTQRVRRLRTAMTRALSGMETAKPLDAAPYEILLLRISADADVERLAHDLERRGALFAEPNYVGTLCRTPVDPFYALNQKLAYDLLGMEDAWGVAAGVAPTIVAVLDSGIDLTHPDLAPNLCRNLEEVHGNSIDDDGNGFVDDVRGYNFVTDSGDVQDTLGHGTRVAGIIGAHATDQVGEATGMAGICWECSLLPVVVADAAGLVTVADLVEGIYYAVDAGARVINMSLAMGERSTALQAACDEASKSAVLVSAAENEGQNTAMTYPAGCESVLSVGAITSHGAMAPFSNYNLPGVVDVAAPGVQIFSTIPGGVWDGEGGSGTSYAAAIVSGVAGLMAGLYPDQSPGSLRAHLLRSAEPGGTLTSYGLIDAGQALTRPLEIRFAIESLAIRDTEAVSPANDDDAALDAGETVDLVVELRNIGADSPAFDAVLVSEHAGVTVVSGTAAFSSMIFNETGLNMASPFRITAASGVPQSMAAFRIEIAGHADIDFELVVEDESPLPDSIISDPELQTAVGKCGGWWGG